jgi:hypothetical protein
VLAPTARMAFPFEEVRRTNFCGGVLNQQQNILRDCLNEGRQTIPYDDVRDTRCESRFSARDYD